MTDSETALPLLSRYAIMVDVGYIYASAGELLFSASSRREYRVDADRLIASLIKQADEQVRGQLLRVYWYDAARDRVPTFDQRVIAQMPLVKLRLGNLNARGQQKGVDAQIRADMEAAVEAAQAFGVRVHLWGVEPPYGTNQAERLVWESDTVEVLERAFMEPYFTPQPTADAGQAAAAGTLPARPDQAQAGQTIGVGQISTPSPAQLFGDKNPFRSHAKQNSSLHVNAAHLAASRLGPSRERVEEAGEHVAQKWILTRGEDNIRDLLPGPILPPVIDKELLVDAEKELGLSLRAYQEAREWLRDAFWARVHRQFGIGVGKSKG